MPRNDLLLFAKWKYGETSLWWLSFSIVPVIIIILVAVCCCICCASGSGDGLGSGGSWILVWVKDWSKSRIVFFIVGS